MGKVVAGGLAVSSPDAVAAEFSSQNAAADAASLSRSRRCVGIRCVVALLFSAAVVLSAVFWLPPFTQHADQVDLDPDPRLRGHDIVAGFKVEKPVSLLEDNVLQLADDIFDEIGVLHTKVVIISIEPSGGPNITEVIFAVDSDVKNSKVSATSQSVIREYLESLVTNRSHLFLTTALFGHPFLFEVLKFPGGFTVIPLQNAFLLQKVQILFNFTLNFSIHQIQENFHELANQLQSGLHLESYENLYISLTNLKGSTVAPPTTIQSSVLLAFGIPSTTRLKELAQTITGSPARNLGLNNSVFGKVKQVSLSSMLQHSLHGHDGNLPPAPAPLPHPHHKHSQHHHHRQHHHHHRCHQHHHHHHHLHHHDESQFAPDRAPTSTPGSTKDPPAHRNISPSPAPAPKANSRPGCQNGRTRSSKGENRKQPRHLVPAPAPLIGPRPRCSTSSSCLPPQPPLPASSSFSYPTPASSPLPSVVLASPPLPTRKNDAVPPNISPSSTSEGFRHPCHWALALLFLALSLCL